MAVILESKITPLSSIKNSYGQVEVLMYYDITITSTAGECGEKPDETNENLFIRYDTFDEISLWVPFNSDWNPYNKHSINGTFVVTQGWNGSTSDDLVKSLEVQVVLNTKVSSSFYDKYVTVLPTLSLKNEIKVEFPKNPNNTWKSFNFSGTAPGSAQPQLSIPRSGTFTVQYTLQDNRMPTQGDDMSTLVYSLDYVVGDNATINDYLNFDEELMQPMFTKVSMSTINSTAFTMQSSYFWDRKGQQLPCDKIAFRLRVYKQSTDELLYVETHVRRLVFASPNNIGFFAILQSDNEIVDKFPDNDEYWEYVLPWYSTFDLTVNVTHDINEPDILRKVVIYFDGQKMSEEVGFFGFDYWKDIRDLKLNRNVRADDVNKPKIFIYAEDKYGNFRQYTKEPSDLQPYIKPTLEITDQVLFGDAALTDGSIVLDMKGAYHRKLNLSFNNLSVQIRRSEGSGWTEWETVPFTDQYVADSWKATYTFTPTDLTANYQFEVLVQDQFMSVTKTVIRGIQPIYDWNPDDFNINVPTNINGPLVVNGDVQVNGLIVATNENSGDAQLSETVRTAIWNTFFPVGTVITFSPTNVSNPAPSSQTWSKCGYLETTGTNTSSGYSTRIQCYIRNT